MILDDEAIGAILRFLFGFFPGYVALCQFSMAAYRRLFKFAAGLIGLALALGEGPHLFRHSGAARQIRKKKRSLEGTRRRGR